MWVFRHQRGAQLWRPKARRAPVSKTQRFRPRLQGLQARTVLSTLTVLNNLDSGAGALRDAITSARSGDPIADIALRQGEAKAGDDAVYIWSTLGNAQYLAGDWQAAIEALDKAIKLGKSADSADDLHLAIAHWQRCNSEEARLWYDRGVGEMAKKG
jgi:uncharacterized protein HemY